MKTQITELLLDMPDALDLEAGDVLTAVEQLNKGYDPDIVARRLSDWAHDNRIYAACDTASGLYTEYQYYS